MTDPKTGGDPLLKIARTYGRKALNVGARMADVAVHLQNPSPIAVLTVGAKLLNVIEDARTKLADEIRATWAPVEGLDALSRWCFEACRDRGIVRSREGSRAEGVFSGVVGGSEIAWVVNGKNGDAEGPWVRKPGADVSSFLGRVAWETLGPHLLVKRHSKSWFDYRLDLLRDDLSGTLPSSLGRRLYEEDVAPFRAKGHGRTFLLYGESGAGKSHLMRHIAQQAGGFTLRVPVEEIGEARFVDAVRLLRPNAVLIDDLDRAGTAEKMLADVEALNEQQMLLLVSINDATKLDHALLRPGRFDRYVEVVEVDPEVVEGAVRGLPPEAAAVLRKLPIAYVDAFRTDRAVLGDERALEYLRELNERREFILKRANAEKKAPA